MNAIYRRYRTEEAFREALFAAARRERNAAIARFLAASADYFSLKGPSHAARAHLARQG
ncbi:MAG TPA: hypothetical protein VFB08_04015 [Burkholderiales bacterium]|nr:hypothetical protein [Burkholderiales bacterium]